jgi:RNA polymerase sigma-70 factor, ECF subfamily
VCLRKPLVGANLEAPAGSVNRALTPGPGGRLTGDRMAKDNEPNENSADLELIARWSAGDERAATHLVERHAPALARFAASLGQRSDIEELVQDTLVRAFGSIESFRADSSLRTWLFTIERRLILDRRRAERRRKDDTAVDERDAATEFDALDEIVAEEAQTRVQRAVEQLSRLQREVFLLRVNEGLSYKEIAEVVGSTEGAARVHYHNAMRAVKESLYV